MPAAPDPSNIYSEIRPGNLAAGVAEVPLRVYVPDGLANTVSEIDPATHQIVATFPTSREPQHIVPSYDLHTLWVLDNAGNDVIPIDPLSGQPGARIPVDDPYNMYFTPDGASAIVVAESRKRLDFRDAHTMAFQSSLEVPGCAGINHADYAIDGSYLIATCEFAGRLAKIDVAHRQVLGYLDLGRGAMPQDVRAGPDGRTFYVADMTANGLVVVDGETFTKTTFIPTGVGTHGITPSRDGRLLYVADRGSMKVPGPPHGAGSVAVVDVASGTVSERWVIPGGGSPDMGGLTPDGSQLWLSGRYDAEVYVFDTTKGFLARIPVGGGPHGLAVWPQPGRYSLGHTGNLR